MTSFRQKYLTKPIHRWARDALPRLSKTESEALSAGEVWWEAELFSGNPDWSKLSEVAAPKLTPDEQAFIDGPCVALCEMLDDWAINHESADLPPEVWKFMGDKGFFGMIIPKEHGGLGFSAFGHSEVVRYISTRSVAAAVTVMVPNSLGPGELLLQFGTKDQQEHWLPRLADGRELPAFGLTSAEAGSDASAMVDEGVICHGTWNGEEVLGIRLNWAKRYITLAPVCTVLGLAFKLRDPDGLVGDEADIGITCALVPTDLPGVVTGRRHIPSSTMFQNGPTEGHDVFIPLDNIIGGAERAGQGWMMLMSALAAGRGISLPSLSAAAMSLCAHSSGAYARVREQFGLPIGKFEGIQAPLGALAAGAYELDAARRLTCAGLDEGRSLAVISAIMKLHGTNRMREGLNHAMDIHSGKTVIDGPKNYLMPLYKAMPIGITVEGANIVTRNLIVFGQGSIRAHPHLLDEMQALEEEDEEKSIEAFDRHFWAHVGHSTKTFFRALGRGWTGGLFAPAPDAGGATWIYRQVARWSAAYALTADFAFLTMGGGLKRKEMISARMGDILSDLYILTAALKRWQDDGRPSADLPLLEYSAHSALARIHRSMDEVLANLPARWAAWLLRAVTRTGRAARGPDDKITQACAELLLNPSKTRDRIVGRLHSSGRRDDLGALEDAFARVIEAEPIRKRLREGKQTPEQGLADGRITEAEKAQLDAMQKAVAKVIAVDDFTPEALGRHFPAYAHDHKSRPEAAE
ncbi:acyl-CoA dehydrogenase [Allosediminivita pacifica]|uniref:Acyl-coenzyme A dehydrogenase n=1 Tax=Allosediminivita pacifica TaxID=1267769 RepID=A0A2T6B9G4_9RHOB|nr:acyl-CoA dehydrogenase [Allosediminivita pacifica]PTX52717.1 acyl-CoA dehydrogenase [Allosediminivita pacifica]GGA96402.1 acyl-CoA dehydrogenase [Allosediminivita pacifica]